MGAGGGRPKPPGTEQAQVPAASSPFGPPLPQPEAQVGWPARGAYFPRDSHGGTDWAARPASMPRFCPGPGAQNERNRHQQCQKRTPEAISSCPSMARSKEPTSTYACVPADVSCAGPGPDLPCSPTRVVRRPLHYFSYATHRRSRSIPPPTSTTSKPPDWMFVSCDTMLVL